MRGSRDLYISRTEHEGKKSVLKQLSFSRIRTFLVIAGIGALAGVQIYNPTKRVIEATAAVVLMAILWSFSTQGALWFILLAYPFPFAISLGNSNFIFLILIFIIYLIRVSAGQASIRNDRYFGLPIVLIVLTYLLSFYNQDTTSHVMRYAIKSTANFFATLLLFYLMINFIDNQQRLEKTIRISAVTTALVITFTFIELMFPGRTIIPNWLQTRHEVHLVMRNIRTGGPWHDFELNAEFFSLMAPIIFLMVIRTKRLLTRSLFFGLLVATFFMMFTTITRGAFISLIIGAIYMAFICRRDLNFVRFVTIAAGFVAMIFILESFVAKHTISGSLFDRILTTTFEKGIVPSNRVETWFGAIERGMKHPIIGHGPGWDFYGLGQPSDRVSWPHNVYLLFFNFTGFAGLAAFLFLIYRLFQATLLGLRASLIHSPLPEALMKMLHVSLVMFLIDQIKIEYLRNEIYVYFTWFLFGLIAVTRHVILEQKKRERMAAAPSFKEIPALTR